MRPCLGRDLRSRRKVSELRVPATARPTGVRRKRTGGPRSWLEIDSPTYILMSISGDSPANIFGLFALLVGEARIDRVWAAPGSTAPLLRACSQGRALHVPTLRRDAAVTDICLQRRGRVLPDRPGDRIGKHPANDTGGDVTPRSGRLAEL